FVLSSMELADSLVMVKRHQEAEAILRESLETILRKQGNLAGFEWPVRMGLANALVGLARSDEGLQEADKGLKLIGEIYPPTHPTFLDAHLCRARALRALQRFPDAAGELESAFGLAEQIYGGDSVSAHEIAAARADVADSAGDAGTAATWRARSK